MALFLWTAVGGSAEPPAAAADPWQFRAVLVDSQQAAPGGMVSWQTHWELTWATQPGVRAFEIETRTSEGASPRLRIQTDPKLRLVVASGTNPAAEGLPQRDLQIALGIGQLAYRIRAIHDDHNRRGAWSPIFEVGREYPGKSAPAS